MDNHGEILDALTAFGKNPNIQEIPLILEQYLNCVAKNGETLFPWSQLKPLILKKMELVISELRQSLASENILPRPNVENVRFDVIHARIIDSLHKFNGAPFTIQRLCELLVEPKRHYKRSDKFMRGLEKNVLVVSTVDPYGRKVVCESGHKPMVNGMPDVNGSSHPIRDTGLSIPLPPVPGWVTTTTTPSTAPSQTAPESKADTENIEVTLETSEVSCVVTDGGEALAEGEGMEVDTAEDQEASSFSSSSSSSEELSTSSDSMEIGPRASPFGTRVHSLNDDAGMDENRPWAAFAQDAKQHEDVKSTSTMDSQPATIHQKTQLSEASSSSSLSSTSSQPSKSPEDTSSVSSSSLSSSSVKNENSTLSLPTSSENEVEKLDSQLNQTPEQAISSAASDDSSICNQNSLPLDPVETVSDSSQPSADTAGQGSGEEIASSSTMAKAVTTSTSEGNILERPSSSSLDSERTYAQVVASSTDKEAPIEPFNSVEGIPCDSVAGLERLVGTVDQSSNPSSISPSPINVCVSESLPSTPSSSSPPPLPSSSTQTINPSCQSIVSSPIISSPVTPSSQPMLPSSTDQDPFDGDSEPSCKRPRLSTEAVSTMEDYISTSGASSPEVTEQRNTESQPQQPIMVHPTAVQSDIESHPKLENNLSSTSLSDDKNQDQEEQSGRDSGIQDCLGSNDLNGASSSVNNEGTKMDASVKSEESGPENCAVSSNNSASLSENVNDVEMS